MANVIKSFLDSLRLKDDEDDEDDEYNSYAAKQIEKEQKRVSRQSYTQESKEPYPQRDSSTSTQTRPRYKEPEEDYKSSSFPSYSDNRRESTSRSDRNLGSKVVPIRSLKDLEVCVMKPTRFEDSQDICDVLLSDRAVVINLEGFDVALAQRIMDFISGVVYSIDGKLNQISSYIFIVSPESIDISGDYRHVLALNGFEVPTLNKDF